MPARTKAFDRLISRASRSATERRNSLARIASHRHTIVLSSVALASAAGHIRGIERMVAEDAYCIDVIKQIQAVQAALSKVSTLLLDNHLRTCVTTAIQGDDAEEREKMLQEITSVFAVTGKK